MLLTLQNHFIFLLHKAIVNQFVYKKLWAAIVVLLIFVFPSIFNEERFKIKYFSNLYQSFISGSVHKVLKNNRKYKIKFNKMKKKKKKTKTM